MRLLSFLKLPDINKGVDEYQKTAGAVLLDVRDPEEYASGHIPGAVNIPREEIEKAKDLIPDQDTPIFTYCYSGRRSDYAGISLKKMGYKSVKNIGGITSYEEDLIMSIRKPVIAVPIGDPAGIGPEIVVKALAWPEVTDAADVVVIGDRAVMENAARITGDNPTIHVIESPGEREGRPGVIDLIDLSNIDQSTFQYGTVQAMCGSAAYAFIEKSISLAMNREVDAVATTPINKEALRAASVPFIGHTEIFGALTGTSDPLTMFETNGLRIFFLTRHKSIRDMLED